MCNLLQQKDVLPLALSAFSWSKQGIGHFWQGHISAKLLSVLYLGKAIRYVVQVKIFIVPGVTNL